MRLNANKNDYRLAAGMIGRLWRRSSLLGQPRRRLGALSGGPLLHIPPLGTPCGGGVKVGSRHFSIFRVNDNFE